MLGIKIHTINTSFSFDIISARDFWKYEKFREEKENGGIKQERRVNSDEETREDNTNTAQNLQNIRYKNPTNQSFDASNGVGYKGGSQTYRNREVSSGKTESGKATSKSQGENHAKSSEIKTKKEITPYLKQVITTDNNAVVIDTRYNDQYRRSPRENADQKIQTNTDTAGNLRRAIASDKKDRVIDSPKGNQDHHAPHEDSNQKVKSLTASIKTTPLLEKPGDQNSTLQNKTSANAAKLPENRKPSKVYESGTQYFGKLDGWGVPQGSGEIVWKDGSRYNGNLKNGKFEGNGKITLTDGTQREGTFREGKFFEGTITDSNGILRDQFRNGEKIMLPENEKKVQDMVGTMNGEFWDKVRNQERNHSFSSFELQEFMLDRMAQNATGIQRGTEKFLGTGEQKILQEKIQELRTSHQLQSPPEKYERGYFIDQEGKRKIDYDYLVNKGYAPQVDRQIPGAIFAYPGAIPRNTDENKQADDARSALNNAKQYLRDPGIANMLQEIESTTGVPVLIMGVSSYRTPENEMALARNGGIYNPNENRGQFSQETQNNIRRVNNALFTTSGLKGDPETFSRNLDAEQGRLHFHKPTYTHNVDGATIRNEVRELWMASQEIKERQSTSIVHSKTTQVSTWHTDMATEKTLQQFGRDKVKDPNFWNGFIREYNKSYQTHGAYIQEAYEKDMKGQPDALSHPTEDNKKYAARLYTESLAKSLNISPENIPLDWEFGTDRQGRTIIRPVIKTR